MKKPNKLDRYIRNQKEVKVESHTTSVNIEKRHQDFLKRRNLNLSRMIRDFLDTLITEEESGIL